MFFVCMFDELDILGLVSVALHVFIDIVLFRKYRGIFIAMLILPIIMSLGYSAIEAKQNACLAEEEARYEAATEEERATQEFGTKCLTG